MRIVVLCSGYVGNGVLDYLNKWIEGSDEIIYKQPHEWSDEYDNLGSRRAQDWLVNFKPDWLICAWWPNLLHPCILSCAEHTLNIHNSFLPWCRGKHPNFWALKDNEPFGVTLHEITPGIDNGKIYVQETIPVTWKDTGESLHKKSLDLAIDLFKRSWPQIVSGQIKPLPQSKYGSYHNASEIEDASRIPLGVTTGEEILNLIRARQAYGHAAWFMQRGKRYRVTINITPE